MVFAQCVTSGHLFLAFSFSFSFLCLSFSLDVIKTSFQPPCAKPYRTIMHVVRLVTTNLNSSSVDLYFATIRVKYSTNKRCR